MDTKQARIVEDMHTEESWQWGTWVSLSFPRPGAGPVPSLLQ